MKSKVLVIGDVCRPGEFHMGDEAMFEVAIRSIIRSGTCDVVGVVEDPAIAHSRYGIDAITSVIFSPGPFEAHLARVHELTNNQDSLPELHSAVASSGVVVIAGGGNLASGFGYLIAERLLISRLARKHQVPVVITSQSIGPFERTDEREAVAEILTNAVIVGVREQESWRECLSLGVSSTSLRLCTDDAIELCAREYAPTPMTSLSIDTHLWHGDPISAHRIVREVFSHAQANGHGVHVVPQTWSDTPDDGGTDHHVTSEIRRLASEEFPDVRVASISEWSTSTVVDVIASSSLVVSSRYHPVVFATAWGVPAVFVSANDYTRRKGEGTLLLSASPGRAVNIPLAEEEITAAIESAQRFAAEESGRRAQRLRERENNRRRMYQDIVALSHGAPVRRLPKIAICTIVAENYIAQATLLEESARLWHPHADIVTLIVDDRAVSRDDGRLTLPGIGIPEQALHEMAAMYTVTEFATAVKPRLLRYLLDQGYDQVWYLDPDIYVYAPLEPVALALESHAVALTPHALEPYPRDGLTPTEEAVRLSGIYNLGFVGVTPAARKFLEWWEQNLTTDAIVDLPSGLFTDQKWVDFAPSLCDTAVLDQPGLNVAYWNLHERSVSSSAGGFRVNGEPLYFFHFSGYDPREPLVLSKHMGNNPRVSVLTSPEIRGIIEDQQRRLMEQDFVSQTQSPYGWGVAANGLTLDPMIRRAYRASVLAAGNRRPPSPFRDSDIDRFEQWLTECIGDQWRLVPTSARSLWSTNTGLQTHFPEPCGKDVQRFMNWVAESRWIAPADQSIAARNVKLLPPGTSELIPVGFNVVGYVSASMGLGEASRRAVTTLRSTGLPLHVVEETAHHTSGRTIPGYAVHSTLRYRNSFVAVNADSAVDVCARLGISRTTDSRTIGHWYWELESFPATYAAAFAPFTEIWVASEFMRSSIAEVAPIPVRTMKLEIPVVNPEVLPSRREVGFDDRFTFYFTYDANSIFRRKNPLGVIAAYRHAFSHESDVRLVIRVHNAWRQPEDFATLMAASDDRPDIDIIAASRTPELAVAEVARADCFVSLHRSEGFGLNIATAVAAGTPVIATNYSGCLDFLDPDGTWLIPYKKVRVGEGSRPYAPEAWWAEPDHDHAVAQFRDVYESSHRKERAQLAQQFVMQNFSHVAAASRMKKLLGLD